MRKFRAIVQSSIEPQDHEVIWQWNGKLLYWNDGWEPLHTLDASEIAYEYEEAEGVENVAQALDKLLYVTPKITSFTLRQSGTYENGITIPVQDFTWSYNKKLIREQTINGMKIAPPTVRSLHTEKPIKANTTFNLWASDGTNEVTASTSVRFVNYIYYGTSKDEESLRRLKVNPSAGGISITAGKDEYIWIFIPRTAGYTKIWHNNVDSTDDFRYESVKFHTDTELDIDGIFYISKSHSLNAVTLKFT